MSDKEVGELWDKWYLPGRVHPIIDLIRKLIEERENLIYWKTAAGYGDGRNEDAQVLAPRDFGIDPGEYRES